MFAWNVFGAGNLDGKGSAASFNYPSGIVIDNTSNLYVTEKISNTIRKITPEGKVSTFAGTAGVSGAADGQGVAASFNGPDAIAIDSAGNLYLADSGNSIIRKITPSGLMSTIAGTVGKMGTQLGALPGVLSVVSGIAVDSSNKIYVTMNNGIVKITPPQ